MQEPVSPFIIAPRAQASRRCETQATLAIREAGLAQPACGWCISPWVDMEAIGETMSTKGEADPMVQRPGLLEMAGLYLGAATPRSPLAAPIYADLKGLAPLLIEVGAELIEPVSAVRHRVRYIG